jgi:hypothetical protein
MGTFAGRRQTVKWLFRIASSGIENS